MAHPYIINTFKTQIEIAGGKRDRRKIITLLRYFLLEYGPEKAFFAATLRTLVEHRIKMPSLLRSIYKLKPIFINDLQFLRDLKEAAALHNRYDIALDAYTCLGENATLSDYATMMELAQENNDIAVAENIFERAKECISLQKIWGDLYGSGRYLRSFCSNFILITTSHKKFDLAIEALQLALVHRKAGFDDLDRCVKAFPKEADFLIKMVLNIPNGLRLILGIDPFINYHGVMPEKMQKNNYLERLVHNFPNFKRIFMDKKNQMRDYHKVLEKADLYLKSRAEIKKNAQYFLGARKTNSSFFPDYIEAEIVSYTAEKTTHVPKEAEAISRAYLIR